MDKDNFLISFLKVRDEQPYGIHLFEDKWYLIDRGYNKISDGYKLSQSTLEELIKITKVLKGSKVGLFRNEIITILFYDQNIMTVLQTKGYYDNFNETILKIKNLLPHN